MGWTSYHAEHYKNGKIDRKAECDAYFLEGLNRGHFDVLKSSMVGSTYYAAIKPLKKSGGKDENGNYNRLANPNIDTGMGLERMAVIMQDVNNLFEVDTIRNIMLEISKVAKVNYGESEKSDISLRVITDHIRSTTFMTCDGVSPSNEGRGYVLRRLLRRAARHGRLLGIKGTFLSDIVDTVVRESKGAYPQLEEKQDLIKRVIKREEESFAQTIDRGLSILEEKIAQLGTLAVDLC